MKESNRYLRQIQVIEFIGISPSTFLRIRKNSGLKFPPPLTISKNIKVWREIDVINWIKKEDK